MSIKSIVGLPLFALLLLGSAGAYAQSADFLIYENAGIKIGYPAGWQAVEQDLAHSVASFSPPGADSLSVNVDVAISESPLNATLKESVSVIVKMLGAEHEGFTLHEVDSMTLAGLPAMEIMFTAGEEGSEIRERQVWTIKDNKTFLISYSAAVDKYDQYYSIAQDMVDSFEIVATEVVSLPPSQTGGRYVNADLGLQIDLPDGWRGVELTGDIAAEGQTDLAASLFTASGNEYYYNYVIFPPGDKDVALMAIFSGSAADIYSSVSAGCGLPGEAAIVSVGAGVGMKAVEASAECAIAEETAKMKTYALAAEEGKVVYLALAASSEQAFESNIVEFENSVGTAKLEKTVDLSEGFVPIGYSASSNAVAIGDASYEVEVITSSSISNFTLDQDSKTVSFIAEGQSGTRGSTIIGISDLLEGPYTVMIDGKVADSGVTIIEDRTANKTSIRIEYDHSVHQISITGTQVVPEFPLAIVGGVIAALIALTTVLGRTRLSAFRT